MSYTIDYKRRAYYYEKDFLLLHETGDNNCYETATRRARSWSVLHFGWEYSCWHEIAKWAGSLAGGCVKIKGWKDRKTYKDNIKAGIDLYGKMFKTARPINEIFNDFSIYLNIEITDKRLRVIKTPRKDDFNFKKIMEYINDNKIKLKSEVNFFGEKVKAGGVYITDKNQLKELIGLNCYKDDYKFNLNFSIIK